MHLHRPLGSGQNLSGKIAKCFRRFQELGMAAIQPLQVATLGLVLGVHV